MSWLGATALTGSIGGGFAANKLGLINKVKGEDMFGPMARPDDPKFQGLTNSQGKLDQRFSMQQQPRGEFEQRLRQQALSSAPTAAAQQQAGRAGQVAQSSMAQNLSNMAQRGGVSAGARERLGKAAGLQGMLGRQQALASGEQDKLRMQQGFASQEAGERGSDVQAMRGNQQQQNQFGLDRYKANLAEYAGVQQANMQNRLAQTTGGLLGSGGILGTGFKLG